MTKHYRVIGRLDGTDVDYRHIKDSDLDEFLPTVLEVDMTLIREYIDQDGWYYASSTRTRMALRVMYDHGGEK